MWIWVIKDCGEAFLKPRKTKHHPGGSGGKELKQGMKGALVYLANVNEAKGFGYES